MIATSRLRELFRADPQVEREVAGEMMAPRPCPRRKGDTLVASAFYYGRDYDPANDSAMLFPADWSADFDWNSGRLLRLEESGPQALGFSRTRFEPVGEFAYRDNDRRARDRGLGSAVERKAAIDGLYDSLVQLWMSARPAEAAMVQHFNALFLVEAPMPMLPAYKVLCGEFLQWLGLNV